MGQPPGCSLPPSLPPGHFTPRGSSPSASPLRQQHPGILVPAPVLPGLTAGWVPLQLAHRHPGPGQPPVWAAAEERDHLVRALPLGVSSPQEPAPEQTPPPQNYHREWAEGWGGRGVPACLPVAGRRGSCSVVLAGWELLWLLCIVAVVSWSRRGAACSALSLSKQPFPLSLWLSGFVGATLWVQFGANFSSFLPAPALAAVPASTLPYQAAPRRAGTEAGPAAPVHPEHCNLDQ